jgi:hypothetical protein
MTPLPASAAGIANLSDIASRCDHIDVKTYRGAGRMDAFITGFLAYYPAWLKALYGIRWGFVRLLGMKQEGVPDVGQQKRPEDLPMTPGQNAAFFTVEAAQPERYWLVSAADNHLIAYLCVIAGPASGGQRDFHVITLVEYRNWAGPVYFNVIRPFHHLVVGQMSRAGLEAAAVGV